MHDNSASRAIARARSAFHRVSDPNPDPLEIYLHTEIEGGAPAMIYFDDTDEHGRSGWRRLLEVMPCTAWHATRSNDGLDVHIYHYANCAESHRH